MEKKKENSVTEQLDIRSMVKDIIKQWWVILIVALSASLLIQVYVEKQYVPEYTCSSTFVVTSKGLNTNIYQNMTTTQDMAMKFSTLLESSVMKNRIAEELQVKSINAKTSVTMLPETNLIQFTVTSDTALSSYKIMKAIMNNYGVVSDYVLNNVVLEVLKQPSVPSGPSNPLNVNDVKKKVFVLTAAMVIVGLAVISYMKDTVKNKNEVERKIVTRLLGTIYHEKKVKTLKDFKKRKKMSMLITNPLLSFKYVESNRMTASNVRSCMDNEQVKVLMITSVIENEGKSTTAANLALSLAHEGKKVLLIDCDFRKPALYKIFEAESDYIIDLPEMLSGNLDFSVFSKEFKDTGVCTIFNKTFTNELEKLLEGGSLQKLLDIAREEMDYIIMDTSPMYLVSDTEELAQIADATVIVVRQDKVLARNINDSVDALENANGKVLGCIFNDASGTMSGGFGRYGYGGYYGYGGRYGKRTN